MRPEIPVTTPNNEYIDRVFICGIFNLTRHFDD